MIDSATDNDVCRPLLTYISKVAGSPRGSVPWNNINYYHKCVQKKKLKKEKRKGDYKMQFYMCGCVGVLGGSLFLFPNLVVGGTISTWLLYNSLLSSISRWLLEAVTHLPKSEEYLSDGQFKKGHLKVFSLDNWKIYHLPF